MKSNIRQKHATWLAALALVGTIGSNARAFEPELKTTEELSSSDSFDVSLQSEEKEMQITTGVNFIVNGKPFLPVDENGNEVLTYISDGTTQIPIRAMGNLLYLLVSWDEPNKTACLDRGYITPVLFNYNPVEKQKAIETRTVTYSPAKIKIYGEEYQPTDVNGNLTEAKNVQGTISVPVRGICDYFGVQVKWDANAYTVILNSGEENAIVYENEYQEQLAPYLQAVKDMYPKMCEDADYLEFEARFICNTLINERSKVERLTDESSPYWDEIVKVSDRIRKGNKDIYDAIESFRRADHFLQNNVRLEINDITHELWSVTIMSLYDSTMSLRAKLDIALNAFSDESIQSIYDELAVIEAKILGSTP